MTTRPMVRDRPAASERAFAFRTKPSSSMASCTLRIVEALTLSGWFSTFDTVPSETPASSATSAMLGKAALSGDHELTIQPRSCAAE